jgi:hypothetical protein
MDISVHAASEYLITRYDIMAIKPWVVVQFFFATVGDSLKRSENLLVRASHGGRCSSEPLDKAVALDFWSRRNGDSWESLAVR